MNRTLIDINISVEKFRKQLDHELWELCAPDRELFERIKHEATEEQHRMSDAPTQIMNRVVYHDDGTE